MFGGTSFSATPTACSSSLSSSLSLSKWAVDDGDEEGGDADDEEDKGDEDEDVEDDDYEGKGAGCCG